MKKNLFANVVLLFATPVFAQQFYHYLSADSARRIIMNAKTPAEKFTGYFSLDRYYYTTALNEYLNFLYHQTNTTRQDKRGYQTLEKSAERLIDLIKKEYRLE